MERFHLLLLLPLALAALLPLSSAAPTGPYVEYVRSSCRSTRYPVLCEQCLAGYAATVRRSPRQLAHAALAVTLARAQSASAFVGRLASSGVSGDARAVRAPGGGAVRDCVQTVRSSVDQLRRSLKEMGLLGRPGTPAFAWHLSNVQTWVSAALTDQTTCLDGVSASRADPNVKSAVRGRIVELAQVTSNALALINRLGPQY